MDGGGGRVSCSCWHKQATSFLSILVSNDFVFKIKQGTEYEQVCYLLNNFSIVIPIFYTDSIFCRMRAASAGRRESGAINIPQSVPVIIKLYLYV